MDDWPGVAWFSGGMVLCCLTLVYGCNSCVELENKDNMQRYEICLKKAAPKDCTCGYERAKLKRIKSEFK